MKRYTWVTFGPFITISAAITGGLLHIGAAFATDTSSSTLFVLDSGLVKQPSYDSSSTADIVSKSSIHDTVMKELMRGRPTDTNGNNANHDAAQEGTDISVPTSMLWPAYKYVPQMSNALRA